MTTWTTTDRYRPSGFSYDGALVSCDSRHRLWLDRELDDVDSGTQVVWVMCNPSTADGDVDDPTIRKVLGFSRRHEWSRIRVVNLWTFRATNVADLASTPHPLNHRDADDILDHAAVWADQVVFAWGAVARRVPGWAERVVEVRNRFADAHAECFGTTKAGDPRHPLMLPYTSELVEWEGYP